MTAVLRSALLWTGVALAVLGGGNWINGRSKIAEYTAIGASADQSPSRDIAFDGFPHLTARTNHALLRPLHAQLTLHSFAEGKREFYHVVQTGGRLLTLFGMFLIVLALLRTRRAA
jgi:hypothetical protein